MVDRLDAPSAIGQISHRSWEHAARYEEGTSFDQQSSLPNSTDSRLSRNLPAYSYCFKATQLLLLGQILGVSSSRGCSNQLQTWKSLVRIMHCEVHDRFEISLPALVHILANSAIRSDVLDHLAPRE